METLGEIWSDLRAVLGRAVAWMEQATREGRRAIHDEVRDLGDRLGAVELDISREMAITGTVILLLLSLPALASALMDRRPPFIGALLLCAAVVLGWWTQETYAAPWTIDSIVRAFIQIVANIIR